MGGFSVGLDSDQWPSSFRRKAFSPFSVGIVLSFLVLSAVLVNVSSKGPFLDPLFQRLNSFGSLSNGALLHWPFSVSYTGPGFNALPRSPKFTAVIQTTENRSAVVTSSVSENTTQLGETADTPQDSSVLGNVSDSAQTPVVADGNGKKLEPAEAQNLTAAAADRNTTAESNSPASAAAPASAPAAVTTSLKDCDIFDGRWVRDETLPYYPPRSCPYIDKDFDCHLNGRPEADYEKWRWKPHGCDIPRFNATDFLERLRGKKLVFIGDSLNRNMWESLVCLLRHGVEDKTRVYEISGRHDFKKKGFYAFRYEDYDCSIDFVSSPFLVKESSLNGNETLRLDRMDDTTSMYHDADVLIFNTGHWWTHEKTSRGEDYYQEGNHVHARLKVLEAFKRALTTWANWVDTNIKNSHTQVIFRGFSVTHFRGGPWNSGGQCHKETEPIYNDTHLAKYPLKMKVLEYVLQKMQTPVAYLNISKLTDYRKDAHPSIYRPDYQSGQQEVHAQDCSHWCLPGVPDSWNELLYASLLKSGRGAWSWKG